MDDDWMEVGGVYFRSERIDEIAPTKDGQSRVRYAGGATSVLPISAPDLFESITRRAAYLRAERRRRQEFGS